MNLDIEKIKAAIDYNPESGIFTWRRSLTGRMHKIAGYVERTQYRIITIKNQHWRAGRLAWLLYYGVLPDGVIDHINGDRDDNRIKNLRDVSVADNNRNTIKHRNGKTPGVYRVKNKWRAAIKRNYKSIHLGYYETQEMAAQAYHCAVLERQYV